MVVVASGQQLRVTPLVLLVYFPLMIATGAATVGAAIYGWLHFDLRSWQEDGEQCAGLVVEATGNRYNVPSSLVVEPDDCLGLDSVSLEITGLGFDPEDPVEVGDSFSFYVIVEGDEVRAIQAAALDEPVGWQSLGLIALAVPLWVICLIVQPWDKVSQAKV